MKEVLQKRFYSFLWRSGGMTVIYFLAFIIANVDMFGLPVLATTLIGLIASEITKFINKNLPKLNGKKSV